MTPPVLVLAIGNRARGDDALGPLLGDRLRSAALPDVEVLETMQLELEHALTLDGRKRVIFVDAAAGLGIPCRVDEPGPTGSPTAFSHSLSPEALLAVRVRIGEAAVPYVRTLALAGEDFELGAPVSRSGRAALKAAWPVLWGLAGQPGAARRT